jgi:hypothetical protein
MSALYVIECPNTGQTVSTKVRESGQARTIIRAARLRCPACGEEHAWGTEPDEQGLRAFIHDHGNW